MTLSLQEITQAAHRIKSIVRTTPVFPALFLDELAQVPVWLKLENLNIAGSFKIRGASNALLQVAPDELKKGVIAASAGNHAQGVASTCRSLGAKATIFMPENTPLIKFEATRTFGADIKLIGETIDDCIKEAQAFQAINGGTFIHAYADEQVMCGQGTIGLELLHQIDKVSTIIVPIGGGGLISGIACAVKESRPDIKVIGVQSESYASMKRAVDNGKLEMQEPRPTIADGIAIKRPNEMTYKYIKKYVDQVITVSEDEIAGAVMLLMERAHLLVEGAGAASMAGCLRLLRDKSCAESNTAIACVISGGNIDTNLLSRIITRGAIYSGRQMRIRINVPDRPGNLARVLNMISQNKANLIEVHHNRVLGTAAQFGNVEIDIDIETRNTGHQLQIQSELKNLQVKHTIIWPEAGGAVY